ncbi:hypothetical protein WMY93_029082 [Mugilogobius chulae]|uniref:Uncharacterized protein n=1 Tax=Mugilogobius chulae TaxID=88201 RepID=A0AAW0MQB0_9GOBI
MEVLALCGKNKKLFFEGAQITIRQDIPPTVRQQRRSFNSVCQKLISKGIRFRMLFPATLRFSHDGKNFSFDSAEDAPDPDKRLTVSEALRHPFLTMEHLTNSNSEYAREAIKLMSVTQTSTPGDGVQNQHSKLLDAIEKPGVSFVFGDQQLPPDNERFPVDEDGDVIMEAVDVSDEKDITDHFDQRPEEQLHFSPNISHRMETHEQTAASGHIIIDLPDYSADDANEPDTAAKSERSSSFWSAVRNVAFGGVVALQATTCYALTGSALVAGVVTLPMLVYGGIDYILTNMETTASSSSRGC